MINLTVNFDPGDDYGNGPYTHVQVQRVIRDNWGGKELYLEVQYGTKPAAEFVASNYGSKISIIEGSDYDMLSALATLNGETFGEAKDRCFDQCLIDLSLFPGTIE